jgi:hypothetical protein
MLFFSFLCPVLNVPGNPLTSLSSLFFAACPHRDVV